MQMTLIINEKKRKPHPYSSKWLKPPKLKAQEFREITQAELLSLQGNHSKRHIWAHDFNTIWLFVVIVKYITKNNLQKYM